jgi:hypothetical protein
MATITISLPLVDTVVITVPNDKLMEVAAYFSVYANTYGTQALAMAAFRDRLVRYIKAPVVRGKRDSVADPDMTDIWTES